MFQGINTLSLDSKGRLAIPSKHRDRLAVICENQLMLTINPMDRCLWLYPGTEWEVIDKKLQALSDFDRQSRRTKQMMLGYATECVMDTQGRIRIPTLVQEFAKLKKQIALIGQGNKFEIWDEKAWLQQRDAWLEGLDKDEADPSEPLRNLSL